MTLKQETYRLNVTLKGDIATKFMERLKTLRLKEIQGGSLNVTSASTLANMLITETLDTEHITQSTENMIQFKDKTVSVEKSRGRFLIRFNPEDFKALTEKFGEIKKVDVSLLKCK